MSIPFAVMMNDPYVQKELKRLKNTFTYFTNNNIASITAVDDVTTSKLDNVNVTINESIDAVVNKLISNSSDLDDTADIEELLSYEELVNALPDVHWKSSLQYALSDDIDKFKLLNKLQELKTNIQKSELDSINSLQRFSEDIQNTIARLEELLPNEEMDSLLEDKQYLEDFINERMKTLYTEEPIDTCYKLSKTLDNEDLDPEELLKLVNALEEQLEIAKVQLVIPIEEAKRKELRLNYLKAENSYTYAIEKLLQNLAVVTPDVQPDILTLLNIIEFEQLENKKDFLSSLDLTVFVNVNYKDAKRVLKQQLALYFLKRLSSPDELNKAFLLIDSTPYRELHSDHQELIVETLLTDDRTLLKSPDETVINNRISEYSENINEILQKINEATSIEEMKAILNEHLEEVWTKYNHEEQFNITRQFIYQIEIEPYSSLIKIEKDLKKAARKELVSEKDIKNHPHIYSSIENGIIHIGNQTLGSIKLVKVNSVNKKDGFAETFTLLG